MLVLPATLCNLINQNFINQNSLDPMASSSHVATGMQKVFGIGKEEARLTQLVTGKSVLNEKGLDKYLMDVKLEELGLEYAVISIIGPQSSGKSTLLNYLFGTTFKEMNAKKGRRQTTLGIWIAKALDLEPFTLVIDVEGSDGQERGEDGTLFEKQSALFALAVSDVVLVNMWCKDVGLVQGGSRPLLKIVFEKIMSLKSRRKTTLLFVLRDQSKTPLDLLEKDLSEGIEKIFDSVPKPKAHENSSLSDFFDVQVTSLPNYEYQEELFLQEVKVLRNRFVNSTSDGGLAGDKTDKVHSSEFSYSVKTIWKSIKENKDLDLPAHKIMVDTVRCDAIVGDCFSDFESYKEWHNLQSSLKSGPIVGFGAKLSSMINRSLSQYDAKVNHFDEKVKIEKRQTLQNKLLNCVQPANETMLEYQYTKARDHFKLKFDSADHSPGNFLGSAKSCSDSTMSLFAEGCKDMEIEHMKLDSSKVADRVEQGMHQYIKYVALQIDHARSVAATDAAMAEAAASKAAAAQAAADAKLAADTLAAAHAAVLAARDAKEASDAQIILQQATMAEMTAATNAALAETQAMSLKIKAQLAAAEEREKRRLIKEQEEQSGGCTIL